ncbi:MAG: 4Fe-4S dicluster domain-containing protein [Nitrospinaceae bacterium]|nr:MAG: 4Fe-4S dicluster domain-containing protein [Nitrospinaceae bacterium]
MGQGMEQRLTIEASGLDGLFAVLEERGFTVVGPTVREGAIVYDRLASPADLPRGITDEQDGGVYRLKKRDDDALFGYVVGPQSWKRFLDPPVKRLWRAERDGSDFRIVPEEVPREAFAFLGVRSCEIHAMEIQDRVYIDGEFKDPGYEARRRSALIIAVQCTVAGGTCFCVSMNTGPKSESGFDLALIEVVDTERHVFVIEAGSPRGREILEALETRPSEASELAEAENRIADAAARMGRTFDAEGVHDLLTQNLEHPRWAEVAGRCLSCANCTMVCPTCFCSTVEDVTDVSGDHAERWQKQDSCFTMDFSQLHGGIVRSSTRSRYRQWLTHKLATWIDQFGVSGCTGCGRCITWCPVAIDLTEEVAAIRANPPDAVEPHRRGKP